MINANKVMGHRTKGLTKPYPYLSSGCKTNKSLLFVNNTKRQCGNGSHISKEVFPMSVQWLDSWFEWVKYFGNSCDKEYAKIIEKYL